MGVVATCEAAGVWNELRDGARVYDGPHPDTECVDGRVCFVLPECGLAGRRREISGDTGVAGGAAGEICRPRMAESGGRMLRDDGETHSRDCANG